MSWGYGAKRLAAGPAEPECGGERCGFSSPILFWHLDWAESVVETGDMNRMCLLLILGVAGFTTLPLVTVAAALLVAAGGWVAARAS